MRCKVERFVNHRSILSAIDGLIAESLKINGGEIAPAKSPRDRQRDSKAYAMERWNTLEVELKRALPELLNIDITKQLCVGFGAFFDFDHAAPGTMLWCNASQVGSMLTSLEGAFDRAYVPYSSMQKYLFPNAARYVSLLEVPFISFV